MAQRVTRQTVDEMFKTFLGAIGAKTVAEAIADSPEGSPIGGFELYVTGSGADTGYRIHEVVNDGRGVDTPFGDMLRTGRELVDVMRFSMRVLGHVERKREAYR